jgi:RNA methyltransferase, TrmH family
MAVRLGAHADRLQDVRELLNAKGRREQSRFAFEGPTLLDEAAASGITIAEAYATETVYANNESVRALEERGVDVFIVDDRAMAKISDVETPTGLVMVAPLRLMPVAELLRETHLAVALADLNDPGNAGTLLRSAEAFGAGGVVFGRFGVDPYHPKVVRGAMGAIFRLRLAIAEPNDLAAAAQATSSRVFGLAAGGDPIRPEAFGDRSVILVGHERRGLGSWEAACTERLAIPMRGPTESLNAAIAGSIALYVASLRAQ